MSPQIHYDANIFFVGQLIRDLRKGCSLEIDPAFFLDKIVEDIMFADDFLLRLSNQLNTTEQLVNREKYLRDLYLTKRELVLLLEDICGLVLPFAMHIVQYKSRLVQIIHNQREDMMSIDDKISSQPGDEKNIVSREEYQILFDPGSAEA